MICGLVNAPLAVQLVMVLMRMTVFSVDTRTRRLSQLALVTVIPTTFTLIVRLILELATRGVMRSMDALVPQTRIVFDVRKMQNGHRLDAQILPTQIRHSTFLIAPFTT